MRRDTPFSLKLYRWLLRFCPVGFRENYAGPMETAAEENTPNRLNYSKCMAWTLVDAEPEKDGGGGRSRNIQAC